MKYPKVNELVPAGEHFDESGIVNEGGFLSVQHLDAIEKKLTDETAAFQNLQLEKDGLATKVTEHETTIATMTTAADTAAASILTKDEKIAELNATIAAQATELIALGKKPSGQAGSTVVVKAAAEVVEEKELTSNGPHKFDSDEHPANRFADNQKKYDSGIPAKA